jgi:hypothetical protein
VVRFCLSSGRWERSDSEVGYAIKGEAAHAPSPSQQEQKGLDARNLLQRWERSDSEVGYAIKGEAAHAPSPSQQEQKGLDARGTFFSGGSEATVR